MPNPVLEEPGLEKRPIPATGELLPVVGCGTYRGFDVAGDSAADQRLSGVLAALLDAGGSVIDSSPMYGRAEQVTGRLLAQTGARDRTFIATKVWTQGRAAGVAQMEESLRLLRTDRIDLMQIHNLVDWQTHLDTLAGWKAEGRVRYVGVTHYHSGAHADLARAIEREGIDFVQLNYSLEDRLAEGRLLPLARDRGVAVIVNVPFGGGRLVKELSREPLPDFAAEIGAKSWSHVLLKFVLGHPAVTCAIPGTGNPTHMVDNAAAGSGDLATARERILAWWQSR
jgi:aryl-alcohol dehydrogenase-like predicted oxidoreductase